MRALSSSTVKAMKTMAAVKTRVFMAWQRRAASNTQPRGVVRNGHTRIRAFSTKSLGTIWSNPPELTQHVHFESLHHVSISECILQAHT